MLYKMYIQVLLLEKKREEQTRVGAYSPGMEIRTKSTTHDQIVAEGGPSLVDLSFTEGPLPTLTP